MVALFLSPITARISQNISTSSRCILSIQEAISLTKTRNLNSMLSLPSTSNPKSYLHAISLSKYANINTRLSSINKNSYIAVKNLESFRGISTSSFHAFPPSTEIPKFQPNISGVKYLPLPSSPLCSE